jgi:hypothetical protein
MEKNKLIVMVNNFFLSKKKVFGVCVARLAHENSDRRRTLNSGTDVRGGKGILSKRTLKVLALKFKGKLLLWANYCRTLDASFMNEFGNVRGVGRAPVMRWLA